MDPRHPELALARVKELVKQYDNVESKIRKATALSSLGALEREGSLVVQEICLVAPRIHEAMIRLSRNRRSEISRGIIEKPEVIDVKIQKTAETSKKNTKKASSVKSKRAKK